MKKIHLFPSLIQQHQEEQIAECTEQRRLPGDYVQRQGERKFPSIVSPTKGVEMKHALLSLIVANQFAGLDNEDPYNHLTIFYKLCDTMGIWREDDDATCLNYFSSS